MAKTTPESFLNFGEKPELIDESNNQLTYEIGQLDSNNISYSFNEELSGDYTCYLKLIRKTNNLSYKLLNNTYSDQFSSNFIACLTI